MSYFRETAHTLYISNAIFKIFPLMRIIAVLSAVSVFSDLLTSELVIVLLSRGSKDQGGVDQFFW